MPPPIELEQAHPERESAARACLERTRSAVLNVLVAVSLIIAMSGWLLRGRAQAELPRAARTLRDGLTLGLITLGVTSYVLLRVMTRKAMKSRSTRRESRFFWSHVLPASIAAFALPLGFAYGWLIDPRLEAVIPYWVVPLAVGMLSLPRAHELEDLERPLPG